MAEQKHYSSIDGLRTYACIGIVMMHVLANGQYCLDGFVAERVIPSFTNYVFLFMTISAFGMCGGYYEKMLSGNLNLTAFYKKRFSKVLPFFALLVFLDVAVSPSVSSLYEAFANLTLMFGFLPNAGNISVIGVGWFLGTVFVFYVCFPFFCVLIENKSRAWLSFAISIAYSYACEAYFLVTRTNILFSVCFFFLGGLIYLYRSSLEKLKLWVSTCILIASIVMYYVVGGNTINCLLVSASLLIYAVGSTKHSLLNNKLTEFISGISMEIYLSHMLFYRLLEKLRFSHLLGNGWISYFITVIVVFVCTAFFSFVVQKMLHWIFVKRIRTAY